MQAVLSTSPKGRGGEGGGSMVPGVPYPRECKLGMKMRQLALSRVFFMKNVMYRMLRFGKKGLERITAFSQTEMSIVFGTGWSTNYIV